MLGALTPGEETQLRQTIEMFEVITQSQPQDYQSLEILKEAYLKLGMEKEVVGTSKRIAQAYVQLGQLSSAILEYETILQRHPEDADAVAAMAQIESKANNLGSTGPDADALAKASMAAAAAAPKKSLSPVKTTARPEVDDGRQSMHKIFVEGKLISAGDFEACWPAPSLAVPPGKAVEPFIHNLAERQIMEVEKSLIVLSERSRMVYMPLERYDVDADLVRSAPKDVLQRWCVVPFDRMSKAVMIATANPFNKQAAADIEAAMKGRVLWYLAAPVDLLRILSKLVR